MKDKGAFNLQSRNQTAGTNGIQTARQEKWPHDTVREVRSTGQLNKHTLLGRVSDCFVFFSATVLLLVVPAFLVNCGVTSGTRKCSQSSGEYPVQAQIHTPLPGEQERWLL